MHYFAKCTSKKINNVYNMLFWINIEVRVSVVFVQALEVIAQEIILFKSNF